MQIKFKKIIIHNFLSYGHAEIDLLNKGYCLVSGVNNLKKDQALSNGAGKSSWSSALCWALTGQTIQGLSSGIKNVMIDENSCYVTVFLDVDKDAYEITRYKEPKSDLKVIVNGEDKSGKGIRESEAVLGKYLSDLSSDLIGSIIILGQGLPYKFSNNSPSGRKEVLEKLSKSDYMIQDIKNKLAAVVTKNNNVLREKEDLLLSANTRKSVITEQFSTNANELLELLKPHDFNSKITELETNISSLEKLIVEHNKTLSEANYVLTDLNSQLNLIINDENSDIQELNSQFAEVKNTYLVNKQNLTIEFTNSKNNIVTNYTKKITEYKNTIIPKLTEAKTKIDFLNAEIEKIKNIKDICPTCHQKLPNVNKPDYKDKELEVENLKKIIETSNNEYLTWKADIDLKQQTELADIETKYNENLTNLNKEYLAKEKNFNNYLTEIKKSHAEESAEIRAKIKASHDKIDLYTQEIKIKQSNLLVLNNSYTKIKLEKDNYDLDIKKHQETEKTLTSTLSELNTTINQLDLYVIQIKNRLDIDSKLNSLIKRDFRGFLLSNVINYIRSKAKEYALDIFGNDELEFELNGNNIDISYCNKAFENLSGGEKQKVDLILQFAIRDMMSQYLDFSSNILVLDEIFDQLDTVGCTNVLNLISEKLIDIESMFIISHRAYELDIPYDHELIVTKNNLGISTTNEK